MNCTKAKTKEASSSLRLTLKCTDRPEQTHGQTLPESASFYIHIHIICFALHFIFKLMYELKEANTAQAQMELHTMW